VLGAEAEALTPDQNAQLAHRIHQNLETETQISPDSVDVEGAMHEPVDVTDIVDDVLAGEAASPVEPPVQTPYQIAAGHQHRALADVHDLFRAVWPDRSADGLSRADLTTETAANMRPATRYAFPGTALRPRRSSPSWSEQVFENRTLGPCLDARNTSLSASHATGANTSKGSEDMSLSGHGGGEGFPLAGAPIYVGSAGV